jgi:hypothetical protein
MNKIKWMASSCFAMILVILAWGCAGSAGPAAPLNTVSGQHPANWLQVHYAGYVQNPDQCRTCHGSTTDSTQAGGISGVSCFSCHTSGLVLHPLSGWADHLQHGRNGAQLAPVATNDSTVPAMAGFGHCQKCHGANYTDGIAVSCKACHTKAPHPDRPWISTSASQSSHTFTAYQNAPACYQCHAGGANSTVVPAAPAPAGTAPGCFNATMCHGNTF